MKDLAGLIAPQRLDEDVEVARQGRVVRLHEIWDEADSAFAQDDLGDHQVVLEGVLRCHRSEEKR